MDDPSESDLAFRRMTSGDRHDAFALLAQFDESADRPAAERALAEALSLFIERSDFGFVWMAFEGGRPLAAVSVGYAISLEAGGITAKLDHLVLSSEARDRGLGHELLATLVPELLRAECVRAELVLRADDSTAQMLASELGFAVSGTTVSRSLP